ncbi:MAG: asparagine synthetase B, partial [Deltaproteobacteria bacterium]|nr:asparagine synthetase B [Deltaproteobacteria bacterium]
QIPTYLVSQLARKHVTVSLSGDGGDELFAGYQRYQWAGRIWSTVSRIPRPARSALGRLLEGVRQEHWDALFQRLGPLLPARLRVNLPGEKLHKFARVLKNPHSSGLYKQIISHWEFPEQLVLDAREPATIVTNGAQHLGGADFLQQMMFLDLVTYLPDDIMTKVDRASMGVSLEAREPLLDYRLVELAWRIPNHLKIRENKTKWILREILYKYVPKALIERPKMGFGVPIDSWLRGPLREWGEELLSERRLREDGFFDPRPVRKKWDEHLRGASNWQYHLWDVLMFQSWLHHPGQSALESTPQFTSPRIANADR